MDYTVIFDLIIKGVACLLLLCFTIFLLIDEIKFERKNRKFINSLREIEKKLDKSSNADKETKDFVHAYVDAMEELLTM